MHDRLMQTCYASMLGLTILERQDWICTHQAHHGLDSMITIYHHICHVQCRRGVRLDHARRIASQA